MQFLCQDMFGKVCTQTHVHQSHILQQVEDREVEKTQATFHQKTIAQIAQWVEKLTSIQEVVGMNPAGEQIFFRKYYILHTLFLKFSFDTTVTWHSKHA